MNYILLDTETTGVNTEKDYILEIAWVVVDEFGSPLTGIKDCICQYKKTIPSGAKAVHHITEDVVMKGLPIELVLEELVKDIRDYDVTRVVAHNGAFDFPIIAQAISRCTNQDQIISILDMETICTLRLARRLFPESDSHALQFLRYDLGLDRPEFHEGSTHRADNDVLVLMSLFKFLKEQTPCDDEDFVKYCDKPFLIQKMTFGKHKGQDFKDIPRNYLNWLKTIDLDSDLLYTVNWFTEN